LLSRFLLLLSCAILFAQDPAAVGRKALDLLLARNFTEFSKLLAPIAQERLNPAFLKDRVGTEVEGFGKLEEIGAPVFAPSGTNRLVSFPVRFSLVTINVQFTISEAGKVAGLYFRPADSPLPPEWKEPAYSRPELFHETEVTIGSDEWKLPGTLSLPVGKPPYAAVLLVHGPGPNDRDESIYSNHMFRDLAEGLASKGFAVLRYDKRTYVYREKMSNQDYTLQQETVEDAERALTMLRKRTDIDPKRIYVIAHSLGGYALPRIAKLDGNRIAAAVVLAGNARPIEDVVLDSSTYTMQLKPTLTPEDKARLEGLKVEVARVKKLDPTKQNPPVVLGLPVAYLLDLRSYDPVAAMRETSFPVYYLQGERDFQVTMKDFNLWKSGLAARKNTAFHSYPKLNHLFMPGEGNPTPAEYRVPNNVAADVVNDIAAWLTKK
jgi:pimeloyl-ACP methyl ester carboxylesterase